MHRSSVRLEHTAQSAEPRIGLREMMENPGADDLIEARFQVAYPLDGELADFEIVQAVFPLELLGTAHTGCAEVDAGNLSRGPTQGMLGRLRGPAAGNEDGLILPIGACGPEEVIVRAAFLPVLPEQPIFLEAVGLEVDRDDARKTRAHPPRRSRHPLFVIRDLSQRSISTCAGPGGETYSPPGGPRQPPAAALCIALIASSIVKVFGFWIGGKSLNVAANWPAMNCAAYMM